MPFASTLASKGLHCCPVWTASDLVCFTHVFRPPLTRLNAAQRRNCTVYRQLQAKSIRLRCTARTCATMTAEGTAKALAKGVTLLATVEEHLASGELSSEVADLVAIFDAFQVNRHIYSS